MTVATGLTNSTAKREPQLHHVTVSNAIVGSVSQVNTNVMADKIVSMAAMRGIVLLRLFAMVSVVTVMDCVLTN